MVTTRSGAVSTPSVTPTKSAAGAATATGAGTAGGGTASAAAAATASSKPPMRALVTGGAGFLGRHVVRQLLESGGYEVTVFDVRKPEGEPQPHAALVGDLRKPDDVAAAVAGMDVVFHVATAAPTGENALNIALMQSVNVDGTRLLLEACLAAGVSRVVYTSSASVVFDGSPLVMVDETAPYAAKPMDHYTRTKIEGEQLVLQYNGRALARPAARDGATALATVALRPSGIFGEGDAVFVPTLVRNARAGKMKYVLGSGRNECDFTYAGNVAHAHLLAAAALRPGSAVAGKPYFITNGEPKRFWGMMGDMCEGLGYGRPRIHLPYLLVLMLAMVFEYLVLPLVKALSRKELRSDFTVNRILIATTNRTFRIDAARAELGYAPQLSVAQGIERTLQSFEHLRAAPQPGAGASKKAE
ncbi:Sterol-4-alpha-carboxylate 3-dehydrogenase, decarboxylating [Tetrabaena socialis]|uniref:Sterol-4-alpha-carboxylate 3-dehydrogenase, decarboxylating n=1 Tax=Tetrabaena socialis TaxID=47790 RepID=A0A2J7ZM70_9CHLO|nr:Sterol-4-alpha-carboxylate 3-dehydrogenase, decarboxylating [Tetrabaena socialis]|eukprot:PNH01364.1 Sterol-4-alpha-carboxylate 3-dehydrogenase, decarboxylating [Tetrabaena socialis]